jgi:adenylate kinase
LSPILAISGTPGTGKTAIGQLLAKHLKAQILELSDLAKQEQLLLGKDQKRDTFIADLEQLRQYLVDLVRKSDERYIVVGHFADEVPVDFLELIVILRCNPVVLTQRLFQRGWAREKILENIQAEILGECTAQALTRHNLSKVFEIDTTNLLLEETVEAIEAIIAGKGKQFAVGQISWLHTLDPKLLHQIMEEQTLPFKPQKA